MVLPESPVNLLLLSVRQPLSLTAFSGKRATLLFDLAGLTGQLGPDGLNPIVYTRTTTSRPNWHRRSA